MRFGGSVVLEVERHAAEQTCHYQYGTHDADEWHTGSLHGQQFELFAHVAKGDERGQKHRQRQGSGDKGQTHVPKELYEDVERQPFAYQFVHIAPSELHHEHKKRYHECSGKRKQELVEYKLVEFLDNTHSFLVEKQRSMRLCAF